MAIIAPVPLFVRSTAAAIAQFIQYAYTMSTSAVPGKSIPVTPADFPVDYQIIAYAQAIDDFLGFTDQKYYGFLAYSSKENSVILAIRGTYDLLEWLIDFDPEKTPFTPVPGAGSVEAGFFSVFSTLSFVDSSFQPVNILEYLDSILQENPAMSITVTGHSLGGPITASGTQRLCTRSRRQRPVMRPLKSISTTTVP